MKTCIRYPALTARAATNQHRGQPARRRVVKSATRCRPERVGNRIFAGMAAIFLFIAGAYPQQLVLTDSGGISGFELYGKGVLWWNHPITCSGEFGSKGTIRARIADIEFSSTTNLASDCDVMEAEYDTAVRDSLYIYFFSNRQLYKKSLSAGETEPAILVATPGLSPTLFAGQEGAFLEMADDYLWFGRYNPATGDLGIYRFKTDGSQNPQSIVLIPDANAPVRKLKWFEYIDSNDAKVQALAVLLANGRLYLCSLYAPVVLEAISVGSNIPNQPELTDFAIHTRDVLFDSQTSIYAISSDGLFRIIAGTGGGGAISGAKIYGDPSPQTPLTAVGTDRNQGLLESQSKNIYIAELTASGIAIWRNTLPGSDWTWELIVPAGQGGRNLRSDDQWLYFTSLDGHDIIKIATDSAL